MAERTARELADRHLQLDLPSDADRSGRHLGTEELDLLERVIRSGTLNSTKGTVVKEFEREFAERWGVDFCRTTTSGTAAIHTAIAAIDPEPGDEIITTPITDMGALSPIVFQTAIPVFVDVHPETYNVTAETIAPKITERTRAIIVTHLFGNPCDMDPIMELAKLHDLPVIEDAAQAYLSEYNGNLIGTIGDIGCFSLQQGKHMTSGEGGIVISRDSRYARRMSLFVDKAWGYGDPNPDHYFLAPNYRMTELQGAVALAQLRKLDSLVERRVRSAARLRELLDDCPGIKNPQVTERGKHVYWRYPLRVDPVAFRGGLDRFSELLKERGLFNAPRYIQKPAFECQVFSEAVTFGKSQFPFRRPGEIAFEPCDSREFPGTREALEHVVVLPWNECLTNEDVESIAKVIQEIAHELEV